MPRKAFAGSKLARDAARLLAHDEASPPEAKPSLMDAVRELGTFIETRAELGWTDPMIAELLTEAGYPISSGTLRSYRKRLRDERAKTPRDTTAGVRAETPTAPLSAPTEREGDEKGDPAIAAKIGAATSTRTPAAVPTPVHTDQLATRTFSVKLANLPLGRA